MTEDEVGAAPPSAEERIAMLEVRLALLERALRKAFGERWMQEQGENKNGDERPVG